MLRKDSSPEKTIVNIKKILQDHKINIVTCEKKGSTLFYSCRIEIEGTHYGTNGKGVTENAALASAFGEFMERLQAGFLMSATTKTLDLRDDSIIESDYSNEYIISLVKKLFNSIYDLSNDDKLYSLIDLMPQYNKMSDYYNVFTKSVLKLPETFIKSLSGSNGLCAGNTPEEALCQGICEIFERIALKEIFYSKLTIANIPREYYEKTESIKLINFIENKNYICIVKDLTLNGKLPVVGLIIIDPSRTKCQLGIGSDLNFDIALQRCITEVFQGKELNLAYPLHMKPIFDLNIHDSCLRKLSNESIPLEIMKQLICGDGIVPLQLLFDQENTNRKFLNIFNNTTISNKNCLNQLLKVVKSNNYELYIKDFSIYGFPTYQVFIPNKSSPYVSLENALNKMITAQKLRNSLTKESINYIEVLNCIKIINDNGAYSTDFDVSSILGIAYSEDMPSDTHLIEILLLVKLEKYADAYNTYNKYFSKAPDTPYILLYLNSLMNDTQLEVEHLFMNIDNKRALAALDKFKQNLNKLDILNCYECISCLKKDICLYHIVKDIRINAGIYRESYNLSEKNYIELLDSCIE